MNRYKFSIGQVVKMTIDHPWVGEYDISATITGFGNVFINGMPTYNLKTNNQEVLTCVSESDLK